MNAFLLAVAQLRAERLDKAANLGRVEASMHRAAQEGARAIVFPELFLTGYRLTPQLAPLAEPLDGPSLGRLSTLARAHDLLVVCGFPESDGGSLLYNSAVVIDRDGAILGAYRKTHLFGREPDFFAAGARLEAVDSSLGRIGVLICYDAEFPETARLLALDGAWVLLIPTANMDPYAQYQSVYTRARAMENGVYVAMANTVGDHGGYHFFGQSSVVGPDGEIISQAGADERLLLASIDPARVPPADFSLRYLSQRRPDLYGALSGARRTQPRPVPH